MRCGDCVWLSGQKCEVPLPWWAGGDRKDVDPDTAIDCDVFNPTDGALRRMVVDDLTAHMRDDQSDGLSVRRVAAGEEYN